MPDTSNGRVERDGGGDGAAAASPSPHTFPHPAYPNLPLDDLRDYPHNHMVNLDYPGLQCIYRSGALGAPIFIVPNFLSDAECDLCVAKCTGRLLLSKTTRGVVRTSSHVRVAREETPELHRRLAEVTAHRVENMESAKIIRSVSTVSPWYCGCVYVAIHQMFLTSYEG